MQAQAKEDARGARMDANKGVEEVGRVSLINECVESVRHGG